MDFNTETSEMAKSNLSDDNTTIQQANCSAELLIKNKKEIPFKHCETEMQKAHRWH